MIHVLVADSRTLRVFEGSVAPRSLTEIVDFRNPFAGRHDRDLVSDRPGRVIHAAAGLRHAYEPREHARLHSMQTWLRTIAEPLREVLDARNAEAVVLVAAPRMLGELHRRLPATIRHRVAAELPLDLTRQPLVALRSRLRHVLRAAERKALRAQPVYRPAISDESRRQYH